LTPLQIVLTGSGVNRATAAFRCGAGEHFLGLGAHTHDVDHRGFDVPIWVSEQGIGKVDVNEQGADWFLRGTRHQSYFPVPFFVSSRSYGVRADTSRRSIFSLCSEKEDDGTPYWRLEAWEGTLSFHLFTGAAPLEVMARHAEVSGKPPAPPRWAFAPWHDAVGGAAEVRRVAGVLRQNNVPSSAIWTEDWAGGVRTGDNYNLTYNWQIDRTLYPDLEAMAGELHRGGFKFLGYFNTFVEQNGDHWQEGIDRGYVIHKPDGTPYVFDGVQFSPTTLVDLSNPAAVSWMAQAMSAALAAGFDGWMADYAEWLPTDTKLHSGEDAEAAHNLYPVAWQALNERVLAAKPDALSFVRSGFTGSQRIKQQIVWGGDQSTEFEPNDGLPTVIPIGIGLGVAGLPFYGSDIGGYFTGNARPNTTKELFFRWTELGALSPIMRTHHGIAKDKNWRFDSDAETLAHHRAWAATHLSLVPYLETLAEEAARSGAPLFRAMALDFPGDDAAWTLTDQYLLGPSLLVAPVVTMGAIEREVHLPPGRWVRVLDGGAPFSMDGPADVRVPAPLGSIPVFLRAGHIVPRLPAGIDTVVPADPPVRDADDVAGQRHVLVALGADGSFTEREGPRYLLVSPAAPASPQLAFAGAALPACAAPGMGTAPCGVADPARRTAFVRVIGPGQITLTDGATTSTLTLEVEPARAVDAIFVW
jgi:alpha-glucosidase (family GH31 glycosyl hydrolase)